MNILLINHYAGSPDMGMEYRPYYLAQEWIQLGHTVTIVAANYSHIRQINPSQSQKIRKETIDGIDYIWIKTPKYKGNGVGRILNMFAFVNTLSRNAKQLSQQIKPDVVIASSTYPSDNYIAHDIAKKANAKHIYEVHDLWPLSPMELGNMSPYHPFIMAMQHAENYAYKKADAVISMLPNTQVHMEKHGLDLRKWHYVPNGIYLPSFANTKPLEQTVVNQLDKLKHKTIIGYAGGHAISNALNNIVEAARLLKDSTQHAFVFVGTGNEKDNLIQQAKGLNNVYFLDAIPKQQIPALLAYMDYLILAWNKEPLYRFGISPNKIFDYMMAAKPIIHAVDTPNTFVDEANCGISVPPENPQAIVDAITQLDQYTPTQLKTMGQNGKRFVLKHHDYKVLAEKMIDIFKN